MDYAKMIKQLRKKMILTQDEFAKLLGVSLVTVSRWESGSFEPSIKTKRNLEILFKEYGIK